MAEKQKAAQLIVEHLRSFGPNARVLIAGPTRKHVLEVMVDGPLGLRTLYGAEFTTTSADVQLTHKGGGVVSVTTLDTVRRKPGPTTQGRIFSLAYFDGLWQTPELLNETAREFRQDVRLALRIGPDPRLIDGAEMEVEG